MSPGAAPIFKVGVVLSILLGVAVVVAAVWSTRSGFPFDEGLPLGNKELIGYRQGADFRGATREGAPILVMWARVPTARERAAVDEVWGRPDHWFKVPQFSVSLWWPFAMSCVLPSVWLVRRRRRFTRGFPV